MAWVGIAAAVVGTALNYQANKKASKNERERAQREALLAEYEARTLEQQSGAVFALSQRDAMEERRKAKLIQSRALALAGASGGGASDPTIVRIMSDIAGEGAYRAQTALYEGKEEQRRLLRGAEARRMGGTMAGQASLSRARAHEIASVGSLFAGAGSLYSKYAGTNNPPPQSTGSNANLSSGSWIDAGTDTGRYA